MSKKKLFEAAKSAGKSKTTKRPAIKLATKVPDNIKELELDPLPQSESNPSNMRELLDQAIERCEKKISDHDRSEMFSLPATVEHLETLRFNQSVVQKDTTEVEKEITHHRNKLAALHIKNETLYNQRNFIAQRIGFVQQEIKTLTDWSTQ